MDSISTNEIIGDIPPFFKVYKDGRVERYTVFETVEAGHDPSTLSLETGYFHPEDQRPRLKAPDGESARANIAHFVAIRGGTIGLEAGLKIL
ncbi:hypothetical protein Ddye_003699 [Dipteronia dyeriana]|uniref:Uncharacterized protein n=1 Tax=Dipteronia dyeriana TaxID=168575 RepID=A0AAE0CVK8_9ROSI|nr:hypothetical protein Ddye_003699 [Dipteronia dyeriana]